MRDRYEVVEEVEGLYRVVPLKVLRRTPGVFFDLVPVGAIARIDAIDRLIHEKGALSPGSVGNVKQPWYMHTHQEDNLIVVHGALHRHLHAQPRQDGAFRRHAQRHRARGQGRA